MNDEVIKKLADKVAEYVDAQREKAKPKLRLILPESAKDPTALTEERRAWLVRRIRFAANQCGAPWLIDQALDGAESLETMTDAGLQRLHLDCEKALQCLLDGVSFMDAGLVRAYAD